MKLKKKYGTGSGKFLLTVFLVAGMTMSAAGCGGQKAVETGVSVQDAEGGQAAALADLENAKEQTDAYRAQMENDRELKDELTEELLKENHLDASVMESERKTHGCAFDLPEGFEESEEMAGMYVTGRYPIDASSIYYAEAEQDKSLQLLTKETFTAQMEEDLRAAYGEEVTVTIDSFENRKIDGYPAFRILCHYQVGGIQITQLAYAINADKSYMITYSQTNDYDYMEEYEASAATIRVE